MPGPTELTPPMDFTLEPLLNDPTAWVALISLVVMEIVLGIDNLIFISILTNKLPEENRAKARNIGGYAPGELQALVAEGSAVRIGMANSLPVQPSQSPAHSRR